MGQSTRYCTSRKGSSGKAVVWPLKPQPNARAIRVVENLTEDRRKSRRWLSGEDESRWKMDTSRQLPANTTADGRKGLLDQSNPEAPQSESVTSRLTALLIILFFSSLSQRMLCANRQQRENSGGSDSSDPKAKSILRRVGSGTQLHSLGQVPCSRGRHLFKERRANLSKMIPKATVFPPACANSPFLRSLFRRQHSLGADEGNVHSYRQFLLDGRWHRRTWTAVDAIPCKWDATPGCRHHRSHDKLAEGQEFHKRSAFMLSNVTPLRPWHIRSKSRLRTPSFYKTAHVTVTTPFSKLEIHEYVCNEFNVDAEPCRKIIRSGFGPPAVYKLEI